MKKIGLICLALVLALGAMGAALAMWSETLSIIGTVDTGELDVTFTACDWNEDAEVGGKAVGSGLVTGALPGDTLTVTLSNAYPSYGGDLVFTISNTATVGTIPGHVDSVWFHAKGDGKYGSAIDPASGNITAITDTFVLCDRIELVESTTYYFDLDNDCDADVSLHLKTGFICSQIDPLLVGTATATGTINVHVEQGADELDTYIFNIEVDVVQWNEAS